MKPSERVKTWLEFPRPEPERQAEFERCVLDELDRLHAEVERLHRNQCAGQVLVPRKETDAIAYLRKMSEHCETEIRRLDAEIKRSREAP